LSGFIDDDSIALGRNPKHPRDFSSWQQQNGVQENAWSNNFIPGIW
jgi:hypothetical protein